MQELSPEQQARAARNETLFRALNEKLHDINGVFSSITDSFVIACECADVGCVQMLDIPPEAYEAVRAEPRRFVVLEGHVAPEIERVVGEGEGYVVVEKVDVAGEVAEADADASDHP